ncbi:glycerol dehydratase reactivase beta/small subunit family protein [Desulfofundulus thermosubterraneus]|uniref:Dehydratase medium subunit n=1 Tax=Desulfofundulus thermosubterraneus DSM 16057 TaxID=1121432 RepID=A0A1M6DW03_9FIRM|nr:glycerol dehydratase reactivase beta/small subunit family protein [Desulfofundulus thermosubterraneus]SHI77447.1 Dehydratase medium subunit [Desulfofundulus thermosubterraneus DSM 16057]
MSPVYARWTGERPAVVLMCPGRNVSEVLRREILLGLEEEGVPVVVQEGNGDAEELGHQAARLSPLEVGIGLDGQGKAVIHHRKLRRHQPVFTAHLNLRPEAARIVGTNAARLVKVLPFKSV